MTLILKSVNINNYKVYNKSTYNHNKPLDTTQIFMNGVETEGETYSPIFFAGKYVYLMLRGITFADICRYYSKG